MKFVMCLKGSAVAPRKHNCPSFEKDFRLILNTLEEKEVFISKPQHIKDTATIA